MICSGVSVFAGISYPSLKTDVVLNKLDWTILLRSLTSNIYFTTEDGLAQAWAKAANGRILFASNPWS
jgi:hypothetical protein